MALCFLTGVHFPLEEGHVLNRREAHHLLRTLKDRVGSLQHLIDEFAVLDEASDQQFAGAGPPSRKRHRMVCKAVAEALAPGYPEIKLILRWPDYLAYTRLREFRSLRDHPLYGSAIAALTDDALLKASALGNRVLRMLDPRRELPPRICVAIKAGICVKHHTVSPAELVRLIRTAIFENRGLKDLGVPEEEQEHLLASLDSGLGTDYPYLARGQHNDESQQRS